MAGRLSRLTGLASTMRRLDQVAHAELAAAHDEQERARKRAKNAHAAAAAARSRSGTLTAFLASRQAAAAQVGAAQQRDDETTAAADRVAAAQAALVAARIRTATFDRLAAAARTERDAALNKIDATTIEDAITLRHSQGEHA